MSRKKVGTSPAECVFLNQRHRFGKAKKLTGGGGDEILEILFNAGLAGHEAILKNQHGSGVAKWLHMGIGHFKTT